MGENKKEFNDGTASERVYPQSNQVPPLKGSSAEQKMVSAEIPFTKDAEGKLHFDKYEILEELGAGRFGVVLKAREKTTSRIVALKILKATQFLENDEVKKRFEREAKVIAKLNHPNIVKLYESGLWQGFAFFSMEYINGETLSRIVERLKVVSPKAAFKIIREIALSLHYAHSQDVIHRDIKSSNIMLAQKDTIDVPAQDIKRIKDTSLSLRTGITDNYQVLLTDFGVAKEMHSEKLTLTGDIIGTPVYMSPEQVDGDQKKITHQTDIYSLGVVLYEMVTGQLLYRGTVYEILHLIRSKDDPPAPRTIISNLSRDAEAVILKAISKESELRYQNALEFAQDCDYYLKGEPVKARPWSLTSKIRRIVKRNPIPLRIALSTLVVSAIFVVWFTVILPQIKKHQKTIFIQNKKQEALIFKQRTENEAKALFKNASEEKDPDRAISLCEGLLGKYEKFNTKDATDDIYIKELLPFSIPLIDTYLLMARVNEQKKEPTKSLANYAKAYQTSIGSSVAIKPMLQLCIYLIKTQDYLSAQRLLKRLTEQYLKQPETAEAYFYLAYVSEVLFDFEEAKYYYRKFLSTSQGNIISQDFQEQIDEELKHHRSFAAWLDNDKITSAKESIEILELLTPSKSVFISADRIIVGDIDNDGQNEIMGVTYQQKLIILKRIQNDFKSIWEGDLGFSEENPFGYLKVYDMDKDGKNELLVTGGEISKGIGQFVVTRWNGQGFTEIFRDDTIASAVNSICLSDIDNDGAEEVLIGLGTYGRALLIYKRHPQKFFEKIVHHYFRHPEKKSNSEVNYVEVVDLDADGRKEIIVGTGPWEARKSGYRVFIFHYDAQTNSLVEMDSKLIGAITGGFILPETKDIIVTCCYYSAFDHIPDLPKGGIYRVKHNNGTLSEPIQMFKPEEKEWNGTSYLFSHGKTQMILSAKVSQEQGNIIYLFNHDEQKMQRRMWLPSHFPGMAKSLSANLTIADIANLDDDPQPEILLKFNKGFVILGYGDKETAGEKTMIVELRENQTNDILLQKYLILEDIASLGLYDEAIKEAETIVRNYPQTNEANRAILLMVDCYLEKQDYTKALQILSSIPALYPKIAKESILKKAKIYENLRNWQELKKTLSNLMVNFSMLTEEKEKIEKWHLWVDEICRMSPMVTINSETLVNLPIMCQSPLKVYRKDNLLHIWLNSAYPFLFGLPVKANANSFQVDVELSYDLLDWYTGYELTLTKERNLMPQSFERAVWGSYGDNLNYSINASSGGATNDPIRAYRYGCYAQEIMNGSPSFPFDLTKQEKQHSLSLLYIRDTDNLLFKASYKNTGAMISSSSIVSGFRPPAFSGFFDIWVAGGGPDDFWAHLVVDKIELKSANLMDGLRKVEPSTVSDYYLLAGGEFIKGNYQTALEYYHVALNLIERGRWTENDKKILYEKERTVLETHFYLSFLYHKMFLKDNKKEYLDMAYQKMYIALEKDSDTILKWFKGNFLCLENQDKVFFKDVYLKYEAFKTNNLTPSLDKDPPQLDKTQIEALYNKIAPLLSSANIPSQFNKGTEILNFIFDKE